jgi:hypothetical protein
MKKTYQKPEYSGKISAYQANTKNNNGRVYQQYDADILNPNQNFLYKRALFGLSMYETTELETMSEAKKERVKKMQRRCQFVLNQWKQEMMISFSNSLFSHFFKNHPFLNPFWEQTEPDPKFVCTLDFKDLGIRKEQIVNKLIETGILPINFYQIQ